MNLDNRMNTATYLVLLASCLMLPACGGGEEPTTPFSDGAMPHDGMTPLDGGQPHDGSLPPDGPPPCTLDCNDNVDCTDDQLNEQACTCAHMSLHGFCLEQEPGTICCPDQGGCCTPMTICSDDADCPDLDPQSNGNRGPCMEEYCNIALAVCEWRPRDLDEDGHFPQVCVAIGGDDCDDRPFGLYTSEGEECEAEWQPDCAYFDGAEVHPGATEYCDGHDTDCNGAIDDLPGIGQPCDSLDDVDWCEEGVWVCEQGNDDYWDLVCTDNTNTTSEICDGLDNDCDGEVDEAIDSDNDGFYAACGGGTDCDDTNPLINPSAWEVCDGLDNECDGDIDDGVANACGTCGPTPQEICDGLDNDCDDEIDENLINACGTCGPAPQELCNGQDDDCDNWIDEEYPLNFSCDGPDEDFCNDDIITCNTNGTGTLCTDILNTITEVCDNTSDEDCDGLLNNGCGWGDIPDLWLISMSAEVTEDNTAIFVTTITCNIGSWAGQFSIGVYYTSETAPTLGLTPDLSYPVWNGLGGGLESGSCQETIFPAGALSSLSPGTHTAWAYADWEYVIPDSNLTNNILSHEYTISP